MSIEETAQTEIPQLTAKDFASDQDIRWCPGCGDYAILAQVQRVLPTLGVPKEKIVVVAGIGCSSRFPYYMSTYGFHGIHGRAIAIASGLKTARPDLSVWVATGDGDCLSIGGNHFIHGLRRNIDLNIMMFNNQIYGLTKGQFSPTSLHGQKTKSSPTGVIDHPFNPILVALGAEGTFAARSIANDPKHLGATIAKAAKHKGSSFIDILQNCCIFNDGAFDVYVNKETRLDHMLFLEHGQPLVFGNDKKSGIKLDGFKPTIVSLDEYSVDDLLVYDEKSIELAFIMAHLNDRPGFPTPFGVFLDIDRPTYEDEMAEQIRCLQEKDGPGTIESLLNDGNVWTIK
jgi:2-oxoglutarate ferredoxin oxidoreductase subunit beta